MRTLSAVFLVAVLLPISGMARQVEKTASTAPQAAPIASEGSSIVRHRVGERDWWLGLSRKEKLRVVEGAIDGLINGWWRAFTEYDLKVDVIIIKADKKSTPAKLWLDVDNELGKLSGEQKRSVPTFSKKLGFYIDGIDHFYQAYPKATQVTVGETLQCLSDKPWKSCATVAKIFSGSGR